MSKKVFELVRSGATKVADIPLRTYAAVVTAPLLAENATAAGWATAANNIKDLGNSAAIAITALCMAGGIGAIGYAGKLLLKKSGDRGDDVEWSKIGYAVLGGAFLLSVGFIAMTTVETLGGSSADIGKTVTTIK